MMSLLDDGLDDESLLAVVFGAVRSGSVCWVIVRGFDIEIALSLDRLFFLFRQFFCWEISNVSQFV